MNNLTIIGRITKDLELKNVGSKNTAMVQFNVAVSRSYKNAKGEYVTDFFRCTAFGNQAETINKFFKKGSMIALSGAMQNDKYEKDGASVDSWQLHVEKIDFCGLNNKSNEKSNEPKMTPVADQSELPF